MVSDLYRMVGAFALTTVNRLLVVYCALSFIGSIIAAKASSINMLIGGIVLTRYVSSVPWTIIS